MEILEQELAETIKAWPTVSRVVSTLHTEDQYKRAIQLLDSLIDKVSDREDPILESLIDTLGTLIKDFEDRTIDEPEGEPIGCLKYLMEAHNLQSSDLREIGNHKIVSDILNKKRELNIKQIKALSEKFNVSPAVFI